MTSIILELQSLAANPNSDVEELVSKTLMVARKLKINELTEWCNNELQGYSSKNLPKYRIFYGELKAFNPYRGDVPFILPDELRERVTRVEYTSSISEIRNLLKTKNNNFIRILSSKEKQFLMNLQDTPFPLEPKIIIYPINLMNIQSKVRQLILAWALRLEEEGILGDGIQFTKSKQEKAMSNQFNIQNMQGFIGDIFGGNVQQNIQDGIHIEKENFNKLANFLAKNGIPSAELEDLRNALIEDGQPTDKKFGSKVSAWIGNIITKASTGAIDVSVGTIAGILTNAISKYYGLM
ncbi:TPA: hypothetical protein WGP97_000073 [Neisseria meningitidis]